MISSINFKIIVAILAMIVLAVLTGLIATTANPVLIALVVGLMGGVALLMVPRVSIWIIIVFGLTSGFFVSLLPGLSKVPWALTLLSMLLLLPGLIKFTEVKKIPVFIWISLIFIFYALLVSVTQWNSLPQLFAGFKRYFQMYGLMFALVLLAFKPEDYKHWLKLMLIIALVQLPFALFEHFILASMRLGRGVGAAEASDVVAGTLGANMEGGSANAEMATFLIMAMAFLVARWREGLIEKSRTMLLCLVCLLPLGLGETKVVIVLLPIVWLILMRDDIKKKSGRFVLQFLGLLIVTSILGLIYLGLNNGVSGDVLSQTLNYNVGSQGYGNFILNRTTVIGFWWANHSWNDPVVLLFGHGLGSSYFSPGNSVPGHVAVRYIGYGIDLTSASSILWDTGLLGLLLFMAIFVAAWSTAGRLRKISDTRFVRADALAIQSCIVVLLIFVFYDSALVNMQSFELICALILGYLGYLARKENSFPHL
jgi:hypothetical protein